MNRKKILNSLKKDPVMGKVVARHEFPELEKPGDLFVEIIENILGQQLSGGPARIITKRFWGLFKKPPTAGQVLAVPDQKIRDCGTSWAKVKYIKSFCEAVESGSLDLEKVRGFEDEEVILELTKVKGIGRWTAEMILIFHLQRPDVFSLGDLGLRSAVAELYGVDRENLKVIGKITERWKPYRSVASLYLWQWRDGPKKA